MELKTEHGTDPTRERMLHEPISKIVVQLAIPTTISQIISVIYNTADTYFVAHLGKSAAAAVGVGFSLMSMIQAIGMGFGMGAGSLISRQLGAQEKEAADRSGSSALAAAVLLSVLFALTGILNITGLMRLLGSSDSMLPYACDYAFYILIGCPAMCAALVLNIVLRAEGRARYAMIGITTGGILNIILDPLFIYTFGFGIAGAAIATSLSQIVSLLILLMPFLTNRSIVRLGIKRISRKPAEYRRILTTGAPTICRQGLASLASALLNRRARLYGDAAVAAVTIANKIYLLVRNIILGIGQGFQPVAGYNFGAGDRERTRRAFVFTCILGTVISTAAAGLVFLSAGQIILWFQTDPQVVEIGQRALYFACAAMPFMAYSTYVNQLYQCLGFAGIATLLACCRQGIVFIPVIWILPPILKLTGVQMAQPLSDLITFFICIPFQIRFFRRVLNRKTD